MACNNRIDGVVMTFADITAAKKMETSLREKNSDLETHSAEQGLALDRAEKRLEAHDGRQQFHDAKDKPIGEAVSTPGRPKP